MLTVEELNFNDIVDNAINVYYGKISSTTDGILIKMFRNHIANLESKKYKHSSNQLFN